MIGNAPNLSHIPGNYGLPALGHSLDIVRNPRTFLRKMYDSYGPIFRFHMLERCVFFLGPNPTEEILLDRGKEFSCKQGYFSIFKDLYPRSIMLLDFEEHMMIRKLMQPAFSKHALSDYIETMSPVIDEHIQTWKNDPNFLFYPSCKRLLLDIAAVVFFGLELGEDMKKINDAFLTLMKASIAMVRIPIPGSDYARGLHARRMLVRYLRPLVQERRRAAGNDLLSNLCHATTEEGDRFTDDQIIDHMILMMFTAHDTTASSLTNMAYRVGQNEAWQEKLRAESETLNRPCLTYDEQAGMEVHDRVLKESLRMVSTALLIPRRLLNTREIEGYLIPANTKIWVSPDFTHQMDQWWPNPNQFDPDRFAPGRSEGQKHRYAFLPFGAGAHKCIGFRFAEILSKLVFHRLLLTYRIGLPQGYKATLRVLPVPKPKDDLPLILEPLGRQARTPDPRNAEQLCQLKESGR